MLSFLEVAAEQRWTLDRRPFYNVWPAALAMCQKVNLGNIPCSYLQLPLTSLVLRFPMTAENPLGDDLPRVRTLGVLPLKAHGEETKNDDYADMQASITSPEGVTGPYKIPAVLFNIQFDDSQTNVVDGISMTLFVSSSMILPLESKQSVEEFINWHEDAYTPAELTTLRFCAKLFAVVCMIDEHSELLDRLVLNADKAKYEKTGDAKFVDRAVRRGVNGWDLGRSLETVPHLRRPHFAIRWMGRGDDKKPVLRPIRGSVVHRDKIREVPTGYLDDRKEANGQDDDAQV